MDKLIASGAKCIPMQITQRQNSIINIGQQRIRTKCISKHKHNHTHTDTYTHSHQTFKFHMDFALLETTVFIYYYYHLFLQSSIDGTATSFQKLCKFGVVYETSVVVRFTNVTNKNVCRKDAFNHVCNKKKMHFPFLANANVFSSVHFMLFFQATHGINDTIRCLCSQNI